MNVHAQSTEFYVPTGTAYSAQLLDFQHEDGKISVRIEVTPAVWEHIDLVMLFNLTWDNRNEGSVSGEKPLEITMMFSKDLFREMKESGTLLTDSIAFLNADKDHPMKSTRNWYITEVTEEVDLPDDLKAMGKLRQGFTTKWRDEYK
ncbi:MAG: hypothetical protein KF860_09805 [Cyclobacteriaceae bacterium]|nr:hypothetical protein [Cyclobacteriaceae bacterium]